MPIQLDKILADIAEEKTLHPNYPNPTKKQMDDAWMRVGRKNKLSVHECRSIFKVLQKKYEQERQKNISAWKLFNVMNEIHKKVEVKVEVKLEAETEIPVEEDEEFEMLDVQEEEEHSATHADSLDATNTGAGSVANNDSPIKSSKTNSSTVSPEKEEKPSIRNFSTAPSPVLREDRKVLNSLPNVANKISVGGAVQTPTSAAVQKKSITLKKTFPTQTSTLKILGPGLNVNKVTVRGGNNSPLEVGQTIQLPESIKRKLSEEHTSHTSVKRSNILHGSTPGQQQTSPTRHNSRTSISPETTQVKQERDDEKLDTQAQPAHGFNIITIPANPTHGDLNNEAGATPTTATAAVAASNSTNGSSRLEKVDFRNDVIFDTGHGGGGINGVVGRHQQSSNRANHHSTSEIINLGNFNNSLPPTFFKNLCNSSRHEALGLYVANVMNRLSVRSAAKLELGILRAIIDIQSDELAQ